MNINTQDTKKYQSSEIIVNQDTTTNTSKSDALLQLKAGQTVSGEIVSANGREVQIAINQNTVITAMLENRISFAVGQSVTFEVQSSSSEQLSLRPLFENLSNDPNILKALSQAGLPVNQTSVNMVSFMMEQGMSIDKQSLQNVYKDLFINKDSNVSDVVLLNKWNIAVTPESLAQMESFRNGNQNIAKNMEAALQTFTKTLMDMVRLNKTTDAIKFFNETLAVLTKENSFVNTQGLENQVHNLNNTNFSNAQNATVVENPLTGVGMNQSQELNNTSQGNTGVNNEIANQAIIQSKSLSVLEELTVNMSDPLNSSGEPITKNELQGGSMNQDQKTILLKQLMGMGIQEQEVLDGNKLVEDTKNLQQILKDLGIKSVDVLLQGGNTQELMQSIGEILKNSNPTQAQLSQLFENSQFQKLLSDFIQKKWMLEPETGLNKQTITELFQRIQNQASEINTHISSTKDTENFLKSVQNLNDNVDFMNQLNQLASYIQLPLKMTNQNAQGELYVYTNKHNLSKKHGILTAHLHLDMEHLGTVDVQIAMEKNKVQTKFYLENEAMMDFISDNMELLNKRLQKRGYEVTSSCFVNKDSKKISEEIIESNSEKLMVSKYSFDVRA